MGVMLAAAILAEAALEAVAIVAEEGDAAGTEEEGVDELQNPSNVMGQFDRVSNMRTDPFTPFERKKTYENLQKNVSVCGFGFAGVWASFRCHTY